MIAILALFSCSKKETKSSPSQSIKSELESYNRTFAGQLSHYQHKINRETAAKLAIADGFGFYTGMSAAAIPFIGPYIPLWTGIAASWSASKRIAINHDDFINAIDSQVRQFDLGINTYDNYGYHHNEAIKLIGAKYASPYLQAPGQINPDFESDVMLYSMQHLNFNDGAFIPFLLSTYDLYDTTSYDTYD